MGGVLTGDPGKDGPYAVRVRLPAGYKIPPHTHPTAENVTVLSGTRQVRPEERRRRARGRVLHRGKGHAALWLDDAPCRDPDPRARGRSRSTTSIRATIRATPRRQRRSNRRFAKPGSPLARGRTAGKDYAACAPSSLSLASARCAAGRAAIRAA